MNWVLEHVADADFNDPLPGPAASGAATSAANPEEVAMLASLGFATRHAEGALKVMGGDADRAAEWLFSHPDDLDAAVAQVTLKCLYE